MASTVPAPYRYSIPSEPAATGAQGEVFFASRSDGLEVAVKVAAPGERAAGALHREAQILAAMTRAGVQGVVPCLDMVTLHGRPGLVMPRYRRHLGEWLHRLVRNPAESSLAEVLGRCADLAHGLAQVHRFDDEGGRLVHRDLKPENVFLDDQGKPHLGDFGCAMTIDGLDAVELALHGTPMWAPLDQLLPGRTIPDPTWDTYALCVILYAALTGARPAYQSDPRELLTARGREVWNLARQAIDAPPSQRRTAQKAFSEARKGATAADLIDCTGRAALVESDRRVLEAGVARLIRANDVPREVETLACRGLWGLLVRGLSPLSHPSPPNRYRDAQELAEQLTDLRDLLTQRGTPAPAPRIHDLLHGPADLPVIHMQADAQPPPPSTLRSELVTPLLGMVCLMALAAALAYWWV